MPSTSSQSVVLPTSIQDELLDYIVAVFTGSGHSGIYVGLWGNAAFTPSPNDVLADYSAHECDFGGYAPVAVDAAGPLSITSSNRGVLFTATFLATSENEAADWPVAHGYFLYSGSELILAERFPLNDGYNLNLAGQWLTVDVMLPQQGMVAIAQ